MASVATLERGETVAGMRRSTTGGVHANRSGRPNGPIDYVSRAEQERGRRVHVAGPHRMAGALPTGPHGAPARATSPVGPPQSVAARSGDRVYSLMDFDSVPSPHIQQPVHHQKPVAGFQQQQHFGHAGVAQWGQPAAIGTHHAFGVGNGVPPRPTQYNTFGQPIQYATATGPPVASTIPPATTAFTPVAPTRPYAQLAAAPYVALVELEIDYSRDLARWKLKCSSKLEDADGWEVWRTSVVRSMKVVSIDPDVGDLSRLSSRADAAVTIQLLDSLSVMLYNTYAQGASAAAIWQGLHNALAPYGDQKYNATLTKIYNLKIEPGESGAQYLTRAEELFSTIHHISPSTPVSSFTHSPLFLSLKNYIKEITTLISWKFLISHQYLELFYTPVPL